MTLIEKINKKFPDGLPYQYKIDELAMQVYAFYRNAGMTHNQFMDKCDKELEAALN